MAIKELFYKGLMNGTINRVPLPDYFETSLSRKLRPYQVECFRNFLMYIANDFDGKQARPHLLFHMATGSGKTLIMAGAMLYLYEQGYRNFLFFVDSTNIVEKTKDNFLNAASGKYLFAPQIAINGNRVEIRNVDNFQGAATDCINLCLCTIQGLHSDLNSEKENALTYDDFTDQPVVLISDEAHHMNAWTKRGSKTKEEEQHIKNWEQTITNIFNKDNGALPNILLEFTATADLSDSAIAQKYEDKIIFDYQLKKFREDRYSKDVEVVETDLAPLDRALQAMILSQYKRKLFASIRLNIKPVVLLKSKTIPDNKEIYTEFISAISRLDINGVNRIRERAKDDLKAAFDYFDAHAISAENLILELKEEFAEERLLLVDGNNISAEKQQLLNTLEDPSNGIRAIFAVDMLNEGWDVLNLFDIVRMYEGQNTGGTNKGGVGKTTIAEAQLIGRGARYFPFALEKGQNRFTRKFDSDNDNELKVLEELYYHTKEDSRYISELKKALVESGIYEDDSDIVECNLKLKESFKKTDFYRNAHVVYNLKVQKDHSKVKSLKDLHVRKTDIEFTLSSGKGAVMNVCNEQETPSLQLTGRRRVEVGEMPYHVVRYALTTNPFFYFDKLSELCPNIKSSDEFIRQDEYLGGFGITFVGEKQHCDNITNHDYLQALKALLKSIESEIRQNNAEYEGSDYTYGNFRDKFYDKTLHINRKANKERADGQEAFLADKDWYAYNANFGTSEEKKFVEMFAARFDNIKDKFDNIYLIRNEQSLKIYDEIGRAFEPDFVLFCRKKDGKENVLQIFIEPKGGHLLGKNKWKEDFLKQIRENEEVVEIGADHYTITGVPFYNYNNQNEFAKELEAVLT